MPQRFYTKISKARFKAASFSGQQMAGIGQTLVDSILERWDRGLDVNDAPAPPLTDRRKQYQEPVFAASAGMVGISRSRYGAFTGYRSFKQRQTGSGIRDLKLTGRLRRSLKVLSAAQNKVTLGPVDGIHTRRKNGAVLSFADVLAINNRRWRMWGISPSERRTLAELFRGLRPIRAERLRAA